MAVQLGFDGSLHLTSGDDASVRQVLALSHDKYHAYASAIDVGDSERATYWRITFAILSVHSPIEATFEAYKSLRLWRARYARMPSVAVCNRLLRNSHGVDGSVTQYCYQKSLYLREFDLAWTSDRTRFTRNGESELAWRDRLQRNVKGLGLAKASFAVCLSNPATSDVCCVDTHMYQLFAGNVPANAIPRKAYLAIEEKIRAYGKEFGIGTFVAQWALWDAKRGHANAHAILAIA